MPKQIAHADPLAGYHAQRKEIDAAIRRVLEGGLYILGPETTAFEEEFGRYAGTQNCIGVGNGTDALQLALRALAIGTGDAVITAANSAVATVAAIELAGALPVLCDVDAESLTLSVSEVERVLAASIGATVRAIIPVHLYGQPAEMEALLAIARSHELKVVEDCAQAHGAEIAGRKVGTFGDAAAFSFYPTKNLAAFGDGGALLSNDLSIATRARELRSYGWRERYVSEVAGMNTRLDELQAALLRVRLRALDRENARRQEIAASYHKRLSSLDIILPQPRADTRHVYHQYVIRTPQRDDLRTYLQHHGVGTAVLYPMPIHLQPAYRGRGLADMPLPVAEQASRELLCLPVHPWLMNDEVERVCDSIKDWAAKST